MKGSITINLSVQFNYDRNRTSFEEAANIAASLAVRPIYHSIDEGVTLTDHEITGAYDNFNQCEIELR